MRRRHPRASGVLVLLSLLLAAAATLAVRAHLLRLEAAAAAGGPLRAAVVAASPLSRGTVLSAEMLRVERLPAGGVPPGALDSPAGAVGATLTADLAGGEVVTEARLASAGPVAALVPDGLRAVAVEVALPPGALVPGDRVDVLATFGTGSPYTETVAPEAEVLGVVDGGGAEGAAVVVLLVSPETAERLAFARAYAQLSVAIAPGA